MYGAFMGDCYLNSFQKKEKILIITHTKLIFMNIQSILKEKKGTIVDVRTPEEYQGGNVKIPISRYKFNWGSEL